MFKGFTFPWRYLFLPPLGSSAIEVSWIQYDPGLDRAALAVPNSRTNGIKGIVRTEVILRDYETGVQSFQKMFPHSRHESGTLTLPLSNGVLTLRPSDEMGDSVRAKAISRNREFAGPGFSCENFLLETID